MNVNDEQLAFARRLSALLEGRPSVAAFARQVGVSHTILHAYLKGESDPSRERLARIVSLTGVCFEWLATGNGPMYPSDSNEVREPATAYKTNIEDVPLEAFISWLRRWWATADTRLRTWMGVELERRFPEYEAEKKEDLSSGKQSRA